MNSSLVVAKEFVKLAKDDDNSLTPMQLLKLVYIAHGWMLGIFNRPLIFDEIEAWKYGPVIPMLYHDIKQYKSSPVEKIDDLGFFKKKLDNEESMLIEQIYQIYGRMSGVRLSSLTHMEGSPWAESINLNLPKISNDLIEGYYKKLLEERNGNA